jgi:hypothetical protein
MEYEQHKRVGSVIDFIYICVRLLMPHVIESNDFLSLRIIFVNKYFIKRSQQDNILWANIVVEWLTHLFRIREVSGSNVGLRPAILPGKCQESA